MRPLTTMQATFRLCLPLLLLALTIGIPARAQEPSKLAVLEFEMQPGLQIDRRTFSSLLQNAARRAAPQLFVMTQQNIEALLEGSGRTLAECEGQCAIDTGRMVGADIVIGGRISKVGQTLALSMQMYETAKGQLLAGENIEATTADDLLHACEAASERLLTPLARKARRPISGPAAAGAALLVPSVKELEIEHEDVLVAFQTTPPGAVVQLDGVLLCQATPCSRMIAPGLHEVHLEREGWDPVTQSLRAPGTPRVETEMLRSTASLAIDTKPGGLGVSIDDKPPEPAPLRPRELKPGEHEIVVDDPCWQRDGERVVLKKGEDRTLVLRPRARLAGLKLTAQDEHGNALAALALLDGKELGSVPGSFKVSTCSRELVVRGDGGSPWVEHLDLREGQVTALTAALPSAPPTSAQRRVGYGALIAGGVAAAVGTGFAVKTVSSGKTWNEAQNADAWNQAKADTEGASKSATISLVVAGVLLATGVTLWLLSDN